MDMGRALDARFLVSGSVRRIGDQVRVTVQLTDASNGTQLWAEQYDEQLTDIFEVQDEIARRVAGSLASNLQVIALQQSLRKPTGNLDAYDLLLRARAQANESTRAGNRMAREALEKVTRMSPNYADAQAELAEATFQRAVYGWSEFADQDVDTAIRLAQRAIEIDEENVLAHSVLARAYTVQQTLRPGARRIGARAAAQSQRCRGAGGTRRGAAVDRRHRRLDRRRRAGDAAERQCRTRTGAQSRHRLPARQALRRRGQAAGGGARALSRLSDARCSRWPAPMPSSAATPRRPRRSSRAGRRIPYLDLAGFGTRFQDPALKRRIDATLRKAGLK